MFHCVHFEAPSEMVKRVSGGQLSTTAMTCGSTNNSPQQGLSSAPNSPQPASPSQQGLSPSPSPNLVAAASMDVNVSQDFQEEPESERMDSLSDR